MSLVIGHPHPALWIFGELVDDALEHHPLVLGPHLDFREPLVVQVLAGPELAIPGVEGKDVVRGGVALSFVLPEEIIAFLVLRQALHRVLPHNPGVQHVMKDNTAGQGSGGGSTCQALSVLVVVGLGATPEGFDLGLRKSLIQLTQFNSPSLASPMSE